MKIERQFGKSGYRIQPVQVIDKGETYYLVEQHSPTMVVALIFTKDDLLQYVKDMSSFIEERTP